MSSCAVCGVEIGFDATWTTQDAEDECKKVFGPLRASDEIAQICASCCDILYWLHGRREIPDFVTAYCDPAAVTLAILNLAMSRGYLTTESTAPA